MSIRSSRQASKTRDPSLLRSEWTGVVAAREVPARRSLTACLLHLDDSTLATFGFGRQAIEETGRRPFPL